MSNRKQLLILNSAAVISFVLIWIFLKFELSHQAMFSTTDSNGYLSMVHWIYSGSETPYTEKRPLLYPLLISIPYKLIGVYGIWILQFACWLITVNFTYLSTKKWTGNQSIALFATCAIAFNLSFIALTFQAITEVVTAAFLSYFCYYVIANLKHYKRARYGEIILLILVLLTLVKPLFYYPTLLCLAIILFTYHKHYRCKLKNGLFPLLILAPLIIQMTLVKVKHGSFAVSTIGKETFTNYYFAKCVRNKEKLEVKESIAFSNNLTSDQRIDYMIENKGLFASEFFLNMEQNIKGDPVYLNNAYVSKPNVGYRLMKHYNNLSFLFHLLGVLTLMIVFAIAFFKKDYITWIPLLCIGALSSYYIVTSGLSFWQGDRLVLPAIALWIPLYSALFYNLTSKWIPKRVR